MRVTDHTDYISGKYMYSEQTDFSGRADRASLNLWASADKNQKPDDKTTEAETKTANQEEKTAACLSGSPSQRGEYPGDPVRQLQQRAESAKKSFEAGRHSTLYSSTADLMAIANTENQEVLRAIYVRLSFKLWSVRAAGVTNTNKKAVKNATRSIEKVMGKVKGKIKNLQKEDEMEKKAEAARKAKMRRLQQELRRELAIKRKIRKNKERKDIADSYLESDGQYCVKSYKDSLPEEVQLQLELQQANTAGTVTTDTSLAAMDTTMAIDSSVVSMSSEAAISSAAGGVGGAFVDLAL